MRKILLSFLPTGFSFTSAHFLLRSLMVMNDQPLFKFCFSKQNHLWVNLPSQDFLWCREVTTALTSCSFQYESSRAVVWNALPAVHRLWPVNSRKRRKKQRFDPQGAIPRQGSRVLEEHVWFWYPLCCWTGNWSEWHGESSVDHLGY